MKNLKPFCISFYLWTILMIALITFRHQNGRPELSIGSHISSHNKNVLLFGLFCYQFQHWGTNFAIFRGMASTLRMRLAISPGQWQPWTAVSSSLDSSAWHSSKKEVPLVIIDPVIYYQGECNSTPPLIKRNSLPWLPLPWWYGCVHALASVLKLVTFFTALLLEERSPFKFYLWKWTKI